MNNNATPIEMLFEKAEDYSKKAIELVELNAIDKSVDILSSLVTKLVISAVVALFIFIANIGVSLWIGELLGRFYYGFFVVAGCYALLALLLYIFQYQWIKIPLSNSIIIQILKQK